MGNADKFVVGGKTYDVLSPATFGGYIETIGAACVKPNGYAVNKLFLAYDEEVQKLFKVTSAIAYGAVIIKNTNCVETTMSDELSNATSAAGVAYDNSESGLDADNVQEAIDSVNNDLLNEIITRAVNGAHNLFNIRASQINTSGTLTGTINDDESLSLNGTPTAAFTLPNLSSGNYNGKVYNLKPNTKYVITYGIAQTNSLKLQAFSKATSSDAWSKFAESTVDNYLEFTTPSSFYDVWIRILLDANTAVSALKIYPMICLASDKDKTHQPYAKTNRELTNLVRPCDIYDGDSNGTAINGASLYTLATYTRSFRYNGWARIKIRLNIPTITAQTAVFTLVDDLKPIADVTYLPVFNEWSPSIAEGVVYISANGTIEARPECSGKDLTIIATYPTKKV